jgi:hypothetical protein
MLVQPGFQFGNARVELGKLLLVLRDNGQQGREGMPHEG